MDFRINNHGTIYLLFLNTPEAQEWVEEHLPEDRQTLGEAIAVEHGCIENIATGMLEAGLTGELDGQVLDLHDDGTVWTDAR
jgi:hypothetical protein